MVQITKLYKIIMDHETKILDVKCHALCVIHVFRISKIMYKLFVSNSTFYIRRDIICHKKELF